MLVSQAPFTQATQKTNEDVAVSPGSTFQSGGWHPWWYMESVHSHLIVCSVVGSKIEDNV